MKKIPTVFVRDPQNMSRVTREVTPGCEWVMSEVDNAATRKFDGTNVRVTVKDGNFVKLEKRRNPSREEKAAGAEPGYVDASPDDPSDKHIFAAVHHTSFAHWPDGAWSCEALGPKIQGGADGIQGLLGFSLPSFADAAGFPISRDYESFDEYLSKAGVEGIVFHHRDGRMAKIKARDFGHQWPPKKTASPIKEGS